jgi:hypothetical protein
MVTVSGRARLVADLLPTGPLRRNAVDSPGTAISAASTKRACYPRIVSALYPHTLAKAKPAACNAACEGLARPSEPGPCRWVGWSSVPATCQGTCAAPLTPSGFVLVWRSFAATLRKRGGRRACDGLGGAPQAPRAYPRNKLLCNRRHSIEQQLCRWLLLSADRLPTNVLTMTQDLIANMLGVRREGVTASAGKLREAGLIRYSRGRITLWDREKLGKRVCECYAVVKSECDRLLPVSSEAL